MVVTRKTPAVPPPPASRSASSQPLPRAAKSKSTPVPAPAVNKTPNSQPVKKLNTPIPVKKKPPPQKSFFSRHWLKFIIGWFIIYVASVCPSDSNSVCRSLDLYRNNIIEPYLFPLSKSIIHHAQPHLAPLAPYIDTIKPYAVKPVEFTESHVIPRVKTASTVVVKQYHRHVAPRLYWFFVDQYWNGIIKPIYFKGPHPFLEKHSRPYRLYYRRFILPATKKAAAGTYEGYLRARPHAIRFAHIAGQRSYNTYLWTKPHVINVYTRVRPHAIAMRDKVKVKATALAAKARDARMEYVDPHVRRILDKVGEAGSMSPSSSPSSSIANAPTSSLNPTHASSVAEEHTTDVVSSASSAAAQSAHRNSGVLNDVVSEVSAAATPTPEPVPEPESQSDVETPTSTPEETITMSEAAIPPPSSSMTPVPPSEDVADSAASIAAASLHTPSPATAAFVHANAQSVPTADDVDDFLKDIGLDENGDAPVDSPFLPVSDNDESEDEDDEHHDELNTPVDNGNRFPTPEEQAAITAQKRADITRRHHKWQQDLATLVEEQTQGLRGRLGAMRAQAVEELDGWGRGGKGVVVEIENEAGRLVKGVEGYLRGVETKLAAADGDARIAEEEKEKEKWGRVLEKVDEKFRDTIVDVQREVHEWFVNKREKEAQEVEAASEIVKAFAFKAQADIGLDYAWLDDVTYHDWQKYHDLIRTSENFTALAQNMQQHLDGANVLVERLNTLEADVNEIVAGFGSMMDEVRRKAEGEGGILGVRLEPASDDEFSRFEDYSAEPEVSILPIEESLPEWEKMGVAPEEVILMGRSKDEVEEKLKGVPVESRRGAFGSDEL